MLSAGPRASRPLLKPDSVEFNTVRNSHITKLYNAGRLSAGPRASRPLLKPDSVEDITVKYSHITKL
jgi:hypothetical protein